MQFLRKLLSGLQAAVEIEKLQQIHDRCALNMAMASLAAYWDRFYTADCAGADPGGLHRRSAARGCADGCRVRHQHLAAPGDRRSGASLFRRHPAAEFGVAAGDGTAAAIALVGPLPSP